MGDSLYDASRRFPSGKWDVTFTRKGPIKVLWVRGENEDADHTRVPCGEVQDGTELAKALAWAQLLPRDELPVLERDLEKDRQQELERARACDPRQ